MRKLIEAHRFFLRKSPLYVIGNHVEYMTASEWWEYRKRFPLAYVKFMFYALRDLLSEQKNSLPLLKDKE